MTDRPILFSGPMVRALLAGQKTQTRRLIKPPPVGRISPLVSFNHGRQEFALGPENRDNRGLKWWRCPYGQAGDLLWARENGLEGLRPRDFRIFAHDATPGRYWVDSDGGRYGAGYGSAITRASMIATGHWKVRPSIHMPRWASRLTLAVTDIRIERLQDISEADALAEGIINLGPATELAPDDFAIVPDRAESWNNARSAYAELWSQINGPGSWEANPLVWAVSFIVRPMNIDAWKREREAA